MFKVNSKGTITGSGNKILGFCIMKGVSNIVLWVVMINEDIDEKCNYFTFLMSGNPSTTFLLKWNTSTYMNHGIDWTESNLNFFTI